MDHPSADYSHRVSEGRPGDFFTRLAERALGVVALAQPVIAPVYAPVSGISGEAGSARPAVDDRLFSERDEWIETSQVSADLDRSAEASIPSAAVRSPRKGIAQEVSHVVQTHQKLVPDADIEVPATPDQPARLTRASVVRIQPDAASARPGLTGIQPALQPVSPEPGMLPVSSPRSAALSADVPVMGDETLSVDGTYPTVRSNIVERQADDLPHEPAGFAVQKLTDELYPRLLVPVVEQPVSQVEPSPAYQSRRASPHRDDRPDVLASRRLPRTPANLPERHQSSLVVQPILGELEAPERQPTIRITIGRVEVRAVQPPPTVPARPTPNKAPALSLDDYLKQRNEARR